MSILNGTTLVARILARHRARSAMAWLLLRRDDRLLDDIGITRAELATDLGLKPDRHSPADPSRTQAAAWPRTWSWSLSAAATSPAPSPPAAPAAAAGWPLSGLGLRY